MTHTYHLPFIGAGVVTTPEPEPEDAQLSTYALQLAETINVARVAKGLPMLAVDARLTEAAQYHAEDMRDRTYFAHDTLDGPSSGERIRRYYPTGGIGECIAGGYGTPARAIIAWLKSSGHRAIILEEGNMPRWTVMGLGYANGGFYTHYYVFDVGTGG